MLGGKKMGMGTAAIQDKGNLLGLLVNKIFFVFMDGWDDPSNL
jgi:hypothetical protein